MEKSEKRPYYRASTASQRKKMFKVWEETRSVKKACGAVRLSISTFYYWKKRFLEGGYEALEEPKSHAPNNPKRTEEKVVEKVVQMKKIIQIGVIGA